MFDTLKNIRQAVQTASSLPNAHIEYNFSSLPSHPEITATSFFGIKAVENKDRELNSSNVIRKFQ